MLLGLFLVDKTKNIQFCRKFNFSFILEISKIFKLSKIQALTDLWHKKSILLGYFHLHISATAIPRWIYQFSFDHWSQATSGPVSTWMGDRLGTPGAVGFFLLYTKLGISSLDSHLLHQIGELNSVIWVHIGWQHLSQICYKWLTTFKPSMLQMVD